MDTSRKLYKKAVDKYNSGKIDEALNYCEKSISFNLKNAAAINLKGLLYYFIGDEKSARNLWKMNKDYNKDETSVIYLKNLDKDNKKLEMYVEGCKQLKELKVGEALETLMQCAKSDFNCINVYNSIASCYIYQGKYEIAMEYVEKVRKIDKYNEEAKKNIKLLKDYYKTGKTHSVTKAAIGFIAVLLVITVGVFAVRTIKAGRSSKHNLNSQPVVVKSNDTKKINKSNDIKNNENKQNKQEDVKKTDKSQEQEIIAPKLPVNELKEYMKQKNSDKVYEIISKFSFNKLSDNEKVIYSRASSYMKSNGIVDFYSKGQDFYKNKKYQKAIEAYEVSKAYGHSHYLYPSVLFMLGNCYEKTDDFTSAIKCFKEYLSGKYNSGYDAQVIYQLVLIYKNIDKNQAKLYAAQLKKSYSNSIYNNSVVNKILKE